MLTPTQAAAFAHELGVAEPQIRLDHVLSHLLRGLGDIDDDNLVFLGGTVLCRTHLTIPPWTRLSEDLDLLVLGERSAAAERYEQALPVAIRREFPDASWLLSPRMARPPVPALFRAGGATVRIQLLSTGEGWASWTRVPRERRPVALRYPDMPGSVDLLVPTLEGFAAMKLVAWEDRRAERDLFDLAGLTTRGAFTAETSGIFHAISARLPDPRCYQQLPEATRARWYAQLAHQLPRLPDPDDCLRRVAAAIAGMGPSVGG